MRSRSLYITAFFASSLMSLQSCASRLDTERVTFLAEKAAAPRSQGEAILATSDAVNCETIAERRIIYALFSLPFNRLEESDFRLHDYRSYRFHTEIRPSDILYSTLGFMFAFLTKTVVVEGCPTEMQLVRLTSNSSQGVRPTDAQVDNAVYFSYDSSEIDQASIDDLLGFTQHFGQLPERIGILLIGHADQSGKATYNQRLAMDRAESVRRALIERGVAAHRILVSSAGDGWPISHDPAQQRRVELLFIER